MTRLACLQAGFLMQRRAVGLSQADALRLEEHLAGCRDCGSQARMLFALGSVAQHDVVELDVAARKRAIDAALATASRGVSRRPHARSARMPLLLTAAAAIATALGWFGFQRAHAPEAWIEAQRDRLISGQLEVGGAPQQVGNELPSGPQLRTRTGALIALAHATIELRPQTSARWDRAQRELHVGQGSVLADVDPSKKQRFSVATPRFRVVVLGTRFEVTQQGVRVERGRVRVLDLAGHELALLQLGGERQWHVPASSAAVGPAGSPAAAAEAKAGSSAASAAPATVTATPSASRAEPSASTTASAASPPKAAQAKPAQAKPRPRHLDPDALLQQARLELGQLQTAQAQRTLARALDLHLSRVQRAEALSLRAECALVAADYAGAIATYSQVGKTYRSLPAGDNASFAAARVAADHGSPAQARQLLQRYLAEHPSGHFAKEARARLQGLVGAEGRAP